MSDKSKTFSEFKVQVNNILEHYEDIDFLNFDANLKNGTKFSFSYDQMVFDKPDGKQKRKYTPISLFNAILDIIAVAIMIVFLAINVTYNRLSTIDFALVINTYTFFILFFFLSCLYHFFDVDSRAKKPLYLIRFGIGLIPVILMTISLIHLTNSNKILYLIAIASGAISFFFISFGTHFGQRTAHSFFPINAILLLICARNSSIALISLFLVISGLIPMLLPEKWYRNSTNNIFLIASISGFFQYLILL